MKSFFNNSSILVTGGTGSFGNKFLELVIKKKLKVRRLVILSRDELKQFEMEKKFPLKKYPFLRFFIGDIRDLDRLKRAFHGIDYVIHAAALKQVPAAEYNPTEFIETNIFGAKNLIEVCSQNKIKKVIALSTDKASSPINLYGATKLCSDKLFVAANNYITNSTFSIVRYGNVEGSRGSVIPKFVKVSQKNIFPVTSKHMTRFSLSRIKAVEMVLWTIKNSIGSEIVVPKTSSYRILDLIKAFSNNPKIIDIGMRPGEKLHEELISIHESPNTIELKNYFVVFPQDSLKIGKHYKKKFKGKMVNKNFSYTSDNNKFFLSINELKKIVKIFKH